MGRHLKATMDENKNLEEFKNICRNHFGFLVTEYGFSELPLPNEEFINKFQVRYGHDPLTVVILGEGYGTIASVSFHFKEGGRFGYQQFLPGGVPRKRKIKEQTQEEQIRVAADLIKANCVDVLKGDRTKLSP